MRKKHYYKNNGIYVWMGWKIREREREKYIYIEGMNAILPFFSKTKRYKDIRINKIIFVYIYIID